MRIANLISGLGAVTISTLLAGAARAQDGITGLEIVGRPLADKTGFQPAATELARDQQWLDHMLTILSIGVSALVVVLLAIVIVRFNRKANPTPSKFTHNTPIEVVWTLVPVLILVVLGSFSLPILFKQQEIPDADITIKATGNQWYWSYEYVDDGFGFDSFLIGDGKVLTPEVEAKLVAAGYSKDEFLLAVDNAVVLPVGKTIVVQVTGADVIHSWTIPAFAVKQDAVPGRIAELWFKPEREGIYFGQCSELCGKDHAYMPITVKVVSEAAYAEWLTRAKAEFAGIDTPNRPVRVAAAE
ncbi:MAG: cytochrome c oxidase subunit II [Rhodobacteraceae bacterium]|nr:cytochrome c oxidase subunit II [Paracoccaceae bacterium]